jgi:F5/8 type C domain
LTPVNTTTGERVVDRSVRLYSSSNTVLGPSTQSTVTFGPGSTPGWVAPTQHYPGESVTNGSAPWQWDLNPDGVKNLALNKLASQSSTASAASSADKAVDGNVSSDAEEGSVAQTLDDGRAHPWWQVDLGSVQTIGKIKINNRTDCCPTLTNFKVFVSDAPFDSTDPAATTEQVGVSAYPVKGSSVTATTVNVQRSGRFVRVQLENAGPLSLAEVQVLSPRLP